MPSEPDRHDDVRADAVHEAACGHRVPRRDDGADGDRGAETGGSGERVQLQLGGGGGRAVDTVDNLDNSFDMDT